LLGNQSQIVCTNSEVVSSEHIKVSLSIPHRILLYLVVEANDSVDGHLKLSQVVTLSVKPGGIGLRACRLHGKLPDLDRKRH
jgi:hypothetical protein